MADLSEHRFFLSAWFNPKWVEVSQDEWIAAERAAGFRPKPGCGPLATGGFSSGNVSGTYTTDGKEPAWSPRASLSARTEGDAPA